MIKHGDFLQFFVCLPEGMDIDFRPRQDGNCGMGLIHAYPPMNYTLSILVLHVWQVKKGTEHGRNGTAQIGFKLTCLHYLRLAMLLVSVFWVVSLTKFNKL